MGRKQPYLPAAQNNSKVLHICPYALTSMHNFRVKGSYLENYVCASTPNPCTRMNQDNFYFVNNVLLCNNTNDKTCTFDWFLLVGLD